MIKLKELYKKSVSLQGDYGKKCSVHVHMLTDVKGYDAFTFLFSLVFILLLFIAHPGSGKCCFKKTKQKIGLKSRNLIFKKVFFCKLLLTGKLA